MIYDLGSKMANRVAFGVLVSAVDYQGMEHEWSAYRGQF